MLSGREHPDQAALELLAHALSRELHARTVPGENPLKLVVEQSLHGRLDFAPVVPAGAAERDQALLGRAPGQVVAREEPAVLHEQAGAALRVTGRGDRE